MKYDVFISHSSKDADLANRICDFLESDDIKCWIAPRNVTGGMAYARAIFQGIDQSQVVLLLFSENSNISRHVETEIDHAFNKGKIIIPFRIADIPLSDILSYYVSVAHHIDGLPNPTDAFEKLKQNIISNLPEKRANRDVNEAYAILAKELDLSIDEIKEFYESNKNKQSQHDSDIDGGLPNDIGVRGKYSILQNDQGEIMLMMDARQGEPKNPRFIYDGSTTALLYRSSDSSVAFRHISEKAIQPLKEASRILIVEIVGDDVEREYYAPVRMVKDVNNLILDNNEPEIITEHSIEDENITHEDVNEILLSEPKLLPEDGLVAFTNGIISFINGDSKEAFSDFSEAAKKGDIISRYILGVLYSVGAGIELNMENAKKCFSNAIAEGYDLSVIGNEWILQLEKSKTNNEP